MEEYLKKAVTEMLVLYLLSREDHYIGEIAELIRKMSRDTLHMVFPYASVYRMETNGYIQLSGKRIAPDGRSRQYYRITPAGKQQLETVLRRTAVSCYAAEGFYPPDVAYMQENYGLQYDEETYVIRYERPASNWMPDITVLERSP